MKPFMANRGLNIYSLHRKNILRIVSPFLVSCVMLCCSTTWFLKPSLTIKMEDAQIKSMLLSAKGIHSDALHVLNGDNNCCRPWGAFCSSVHFAAKPKPLIRRLLSFNQWAGLCRLVWCLTCLYLSCFCDYLLGPSWWIRSKFQLQQTDKVVSYRIVS